MQLIEMSIIDFPLLLEFFPIIILGSMIFSFILHQLVIRSAGSRKWENANPMIGFGIIIIIAYGGVFLVYIFTKLLESYLDTELVALLLYNATLIGYFELVVIFGSAAGILISYYYSDSVSKGLLILVVILNLGIIPILFHSSILVLDIALEGVSSSSLYFFVIPVLMWLMEKYLQPEYPADNEEKDVAVGKLHIYIDNCIQILKERISKENDGNAKDILDDLLRVDGSIGDRIRSVENGQRRVPAPEELVDIYTSENSDEYSESEKQNLTEKYYMRPDGQWTINTEQFAKKVKINRMAFGIILTILSAVLLSGILSENTDYYLWFSFINIAIIIASVPMAIFDRLFIGKRQDSRIVVAKILEILIEKDEYPDYIPSFETEDERVFVSKTSLFVETEEAEKRIVNPDRFSEDSELREFLDRVEQNDYDIYRRRESKLGRNLTISGLICIFSGEIMFLTIFLDFFAILGWILLPVFIVSFPLSIVYGKKWITEWYEPRFKGVDRHRLAIGISYLDAHGAGIEDIGYCLDSKAPMQYDFHGDHPTYSTRTVIEKLGIYSPEIHIRALNVYLRPFKYGVYVAPISVFILMTVWAIIPEILWLVGSFAGLLIVVMIVDYIHSKRKLAKLETGNYEVSAETPRTVNDILILLHSELRFPIRLMMSRFHDELFYTGKSYETSTGHTLHEAVFLPSSEYGTENKTYL